MMVLLLLLLASPAFASPFGWINLSGFWPTRIPTVARTPTPIATTTPTAASTPTREPGVDDLEYHRTPPPTWQVRIAPPGTRIVLTDLFATAGGWGVLWTEVAGDLWDPRIPTEVWYAHYGNPTVPAVRVASVHRIDRLPVYLGAGSPDGLSVAVVLNELTNWRTAKRADPNRVTHQWYGRLGLDGQWLLTPSAKTTITTNLGTHGGIGHAIWAGDVVRVATEAECSNAKHQCLYSQRVRARDGVVLSRGSFTKANMGHQTAPAIVSIDDKTSRVVTVSDGAGKYGGLMAYYDIAGGWPFTVSSPFLLDYDPRAMSNGVAGAGHRIGVLWRRAQANDNRLNAIGAPWKLSFQTFDFVRAGSAAPKLVTLSDADLTDWSTLPGYSYGYPYWSRWTTSLSHIPTGGWAVSFQSDGNYVVGQITETGQWVWQRNVNAMIDYAGASAVSRDGRRIGNVTTMRDENGVRVELQEDEVR